MAKVFLITQDDLERLTTMVDRNPKHGERGGSSTLLSEAQERAHDEAHRFYNYQVRLWIDMVSK